MLKILFTILFLCVLVLPGYCTDQWLPTRPAAGDSPKNWPTDEGSNNNSLSRVLYNYRQGQVLSYTSSSTISVSAGEIACNSATPIVLRQNTAATPLTAANLDTGVIFSASTTYYVYAVCDADAVTNTYFISLSSTTPTGATNYRRLGSITIDSASNVVGAFNDNFTGIGTKVSKSVNTPYLAQTDGYVEGAGTQTAGGTGQINCYTDSAISPTTDVAHVTIPNDVGMSIPYHFAVKKGDYWQCTAAAHWSNDLLYWVPSGT